MTQVINLEDQLLDQLKLDIPRRILSKFETLIRESSSEDEKEAFQFLGSILDELQIPYTIHQPKIYLSVPVDAKVHVKSPIAAEFRAKTPAFSVSTSGKETAPNELVYISAGDDSEDMDIFDIGNLDAQGSVEGKVVLSEGFAMPARVRYFEERGAAGAIFINPGKNIHDGICTPIWGSPDLDNYQMEPNIPVTAVNFEDGQQLKEIAMKGSAEVSLETELKKGWFNCPLIDLTIEGTEDPEKYVLLHGHLDSWGYGLGDNATGDAALIEMARVLHENKGQLKRSVRIAIWPGHSTGRYAGSTWFVDQFGIDLDENCIAQVNCDSPGCRWATSYDDMDWMPEVNVYCKTAIQDAVGKDSTGTRPVRAGDYSFNNIGITSYYMLSSTLPPEVAKEKGYYPVGGCGGNIEWHTEDDLIHVVDEDILMNDLRVYLLSVLRNVNATILPYDFRATIQDQLKTLDTYQRAVGENFSFKQVEEDANELLVHLEQFYTEIKDFQEASIQNITVKEINEILLEFSRELILINFSRTGKFRHDPALDVPPLPDLAPATDLGDYEPDEHLYHVTLNHLRRGSNRVSHVYRKLAKRLEQFDV